ncbi:MAG: UDP-N-acetylmuramate dehydrogenase [Tannerella sp.]|nr:UDP-N-acetylmuramate dehydrogenase [Tannerella sp.]
MRIEQNYSLDKHNTFRITAKTRWFMEYADENELIRILRDEYFQECKSLHIGEGSNLLFINDFDGIVLHSAIRGIEEEEDSDNSVLLRIGAAERWDDVVAFAVSRGWSGIENLSLIPGETGAAAIQNIGAYGSEICDVIESVEAYNQITFEKRIFSKAECEYGYRHSYFKVPEHDPHIVTHVLLRLQKKPCYRLDYGNLREALADSQLSLSAVRDAVISIRQNKLPDTATLGSAGSFFMNPVIPQSQFEELRVHYPDMPSYPANTATSSSGAFVKVPAGWLIERCGFKGKREGHVGVYEKQALIIVNHGGADGNEIAAFAASISDAVLVRFGVTLIPEVKYIQ